MKLNIALLDDDTTLTTSWLTLFKKSAVYDKHDLKIEAFNRAKEFIGYVMAEKPDVALVDWHLLAADGDGFLVAKEIFKSTPETTVIMMSGDFCKDRDFDSCVCKTDIECLDLYKRYLRLSRDRELNLLEIFWQEDVLCLK